MNTIATLAGLITAVSLFPSAALATSVEIPLELICEGEPPLFVPLGVSDFEEMQTVDISTSTPWTEDALYSVVEVQNVLEYCQCPIESVEAAALNNYVASLPLDFIYEDRALIAYRKNQERMAIVERGPYWIIFDFDELGDRIHPGHHNASVWQLQTLTATCSQ